MDAWVGEDVYCNAYRALRLFSPSPEDVPTIQGAPVRYGCAFRRFFSDGRAVARIEAGFVPRRWRPIGGKRPLAGSEVEQMLAGVLNLPVAIGSSGDSKSQALGTVGRFLASYLLECTTARRKGPSVVDDWWLSSGEPLLLAEYRQREVASLPARRSVESPALPVAGVELSYATAPLPMGKRRLGVWLLGRRDDSDVAKLRRLRLHLFRLHAEREALKQIVRLVLRERVDASSDPLQRYLADTFKLLSAPTKFGIDQPEILEAAYQFDELMNPGERTSLLAALESARRNVRRVVDEGTKPPAPTNRVRELGIGN